MKPYEDLWRDYECYNCGDVHDPNGDPCYCGCEDWECGDLVEEARKR